MPVKPKAKRTPHLLSLNYRGEFVVCESQYSGPWNVTMYSEFDIEANARGAAIHIARVSHRDYAVFRREGKELVRVSPIYNGSLKGAKRIREEE